MNMHGKKIFLIIAAIVCVSLIIFLATFEKTISLNDASQSQKPTISTASTTYSNPSLIHDNFNAVKVDDSKVKNAEKRFEELNSTERLSIDLFAKYLLLKQSGQEIDTATQNALVENVVAETAQKIEYPTYTGAKLTIIPDAPTDMIQGYGNTLGRLVKQYSPKSQRESELTILSRMAENGANSQDIDSLNEIGDSYLNIAKAYSTMVVPSDLKQAHVGLTNLIAQIGVNIKNFTKVDSDVITVIANVGAYSKHIDDLIVTITQFRTYFSQKGISYSANNDGYAFTHSGQ